MSAGSSSSATPAGGLRLVLFGLPAAGKSALLGALVQAAQTQEGVFNGKLIDRSQGLAELHRGLYQNRLPAMSEEVAVYPVAFEPSAAAGKQAPPAVNAILVDSKGQGMHALLSERTLDRKAPAGSLGRHIGSADVLILVADAAADTAQMQKDFGQFAAFLRLFEQGRSQRNEIAGLPVFIVLTKCDLLGKKTDSASAWMQRIEERKRQIDQGFQKFLAQQTDRPLAFGKVDLHFWATAVGRPALADRPARPQEPYGVAELFRQCLQEGSKFHERRVAAARRLRVTVFGVLGLVTFMALLAAGFFLTRPSPEVSALENAIRGVLPNPEAKPAERLKEPLDDKLKKLRLAQKDPVFAKLPSATQAAAAQFIQEIETYQKYNKMVLDKVQDPRLATTEEELAEIEKRLELVPLPPEYASAWKETRVGSRPQQWKNDIKILRQEIPRTEKWIQEQIENGKKLSKEGFALLGKSASPKERDAWFAQYKEYMERPFPHRSGERLPGAAGLTYETLYRFDRVERTRQAWDDYKNRTLKLIHDQLQEAG